MTITEHIMAWQKAKEQQYKWEAEKIRRENAARQEAAEGRKEAPPCAES